MRPMLLVGITLTLSASFAIAAAATPVVEYDVIALDGDPSPGGPAGAFIATLETTVMIEGLIPRHNAAGESAFYGRLESGPGGVTLGDDLVYYGPVSGTLQPLLREGSTPPGAPPGAILRGSSANSAMNALGEVVIEWAFETGVGGVTSTDDVALWRTDAMGGVGLIAREGDVQPGVGDLFKLFTRPSICDNGRIVFSASSTATDPTADAAIWVSDRGGFFGSILREGVSLPSPSPLGLRPIAIGAPTVGSGCAMALATNLEVGSGGVTSADDSVVLVKDTIGPFTIGAREGDAVPGAPGFTYSSGPWRPAVGPNGDFALTAYASSSFGPSYVVLGPDGLGGFSALIWEGAPAPGIPGTQILEGDGAPTVNGFGEVAFNGFLAVGVGGVTDATDGVHWGPDANGLPEPRLREGDFVPGPQGPVLLEEISSNAGLNDAGETIVSGYLAAGIGGVTTSTRLATFLTRRGGDVHIIARRGDLVEIAPGDVRELLGVRGYCCNPEPAGGFVFLASFTDGSHAVLRARLVDVVPSLREPLLVAVVVLLLGSGAALVARSARKPEARSA